MIKTKSTRTKVEKLAEKTNRSLVTIYKIAKKLGRLPTVAEVLKRKAGRPRKYN